MTFPNRLVIILLFLLHSLIGFNCFAELALTFDSISRLVYKNNSELISARNDCQSALALQGASKSGYYPELSGNLNSTTSHISNSTNTSYSASLTASQNFFSGFRDEARVRQANEKVRLALETLKATEAKILFQTKFAFENTRNSELLVNLSEEIIRRRDLNLRLVSLRFDSGRENKGSLLLSRAYLEQSKYDLIQARNNLKSSKLDLFRLIVDIPDPTQDFSKLELAGDLPSAFKNDPDLKVEAIVEGLPEYRQAIARERIAESAISSSRSGFFPTLGMTATVGRTGPEFFPSRDQWSVGFNLGIPIFSGGSDYYGLQSSMALYRSSIGSTHTVFHQQRKFLQDVLDALRESDQKLIVDHAFYEAAEVRAQIAKEKYKNGLLPFEDWDTIENDLILRKKNLLQSKKDRVLRESAWDQALGKGFQQ